MSILDEEEDKLKTMDDQTSDSLFKKMVSLQFSRYKPNDATGMFAYDTFNRKIKPGDWAIYNANSYGGPNNYKLVKVEKITPKMVKILKFRRGWENDSFENATVNSSSLIKISNKEEFYKEFMNNNYIK